MRNDGKMGTFLRTWREDYAYRTMTGAAASFGVTAAFALYHGYLGLWYGSVWHGSIGGFYLLLMAIRGSILLTEKRNRRRSEAMQAICRRWAFLISGCLLLVLDLALMLPIALMVVLARPVQMGLIPAIAMAAYTTWKIIMASLHVHRQKRNPSDNFLVAELRTVNFIDALVAVLTLQNTLIMVNGDQDGGMLPLTAGSSAVIYAVIVVITVRMLVKGWKSVPGSF